MPKSFYETYVQGPWTMDERSLVGQLGLRLVTSRTWEYLFLLFIVFMAGIKTTELREQDEEYKDFLLELSFYGCIIYTAEWIIELCALGTQEFFGSGWYKTDTVVNFFNWGSYLARAYDLPRAIALVLPNIAFLRILRFLKPLGRLRFLIQSKVVVKTVAGAMASMAPVVALIGFVVLLFGVAGIYLFGKAQPLFFRCGVALRPSEALAFYDPATYRAETLSVLNIAECNVDMDAWERYRHDVHTGNLRPQEEYAIALPEEGGGHRRNEEALVPEAGTSQELSRGLKRVEQVNGVQAGSANATNATRDAAGGSDDRGGGAEGEEAAQPGEGGHAGNATSNHTMGAGEHGSDGGGHGTGGPGHGAAAVCIATVPRRLCTCPHPVGVEPPHVCINHGGACGEGHLCFKGELTPVSQIHGFNNFATASLTVLAVFFQKHWSEFMDVCVQISGPIFGYTYFICLVIFGSFCLLNLTVATVAQTYTRVKKEAMQKKARQDEEKAKMEKLQAERDAMKNKAGQEEEEESDDDDDEDVDEKFDNTTAWKCWALGFIGLPFMHRLYFKGWSDGKWFWLRVLTLNFVLVGWVVDGVRGMAVLNRAASKAEVKREKRKRKKRNEDLQRRIEDIDETISRIGENRTQSRILEPLGWLLSWPLVNNQPADMSVRMLQEDQQKLQQLLPGSGQQAQDEEGGEDAQQRDADAEVDDGIEDGTATEGGAGHGEAAGQSAFAWFADGVVVINAGTMAAQGFDDSIKHILEGVGYFASVFFIAEAIAKIIAYQGLVYYLRDPTAGNALDFVLVVIPTVGEAITIVTAQMGLGEDYIYIALALRSLRVFRITKLTKHLKGLKRLTQRAFGSPGGVIYALLVTLGFIFFCALFANELFRDVEEFAQVRNDFQYPLAAMQSMIEFLLGNRYMRSVEQAFRSEDFVGVGFFIMYYYVANFLVLRMFIALILENFEFTEDQKINTQIQLFQKYQIESNDLITGTAVDFSLEEQFQRLRKQNLKEEVLEDKQRKWAEVVEREAQAKGGGKSQLWDVILQKQQDEEAATAAGAEDGGCYQMFRRFRTGVYVLAENMMVDLVVLAVVMFSVLLVQIDTKDNPIFDPDTRFLIDVALLGFFGLETTLKIFAYGAFSPSGACPHSMKTFEFPFGKPAFFSATEEGGWNMLDIAVVSMMVLGVLPLHIDTGGFKCIRIVRMVRPLQKRDRIVKNLVAALISSMGDIMHVLNLLILIILLWGLMGVQLFRGRLHYCNDEAVHHSSHCVGTNFGGFPDAPCAYSRHHLCPQPIGKFLGQQILIPRVWDKPDENFENLAQASLSLLRLSAQDDIRPIFHALMDIPSRVERICSDGSEGHYGCPPGEVQYVVADQPRANARPENILFPLTYLFLANIFISQLVIGILIDNIRRQSGSALWTEAQQIWRATGVTLGRLDFVPEPQQPTNPIQKALFDVLMSDGYNVFINVVIVLNTLWMATEHEPHPPIYREIGSYVDQTFICIYIAETLAKLIAYGLQKVPDDEDENDDEGGEEEEEEEKPKKSKGICGSGYYSPYFSDSWNKFDFVVVAISVLDMWVITGVDLAVLKLLRVLRVFRLVRRNKTLKMMLQTLAGAVRSIVAALFFLFIWIFIFAAIAADRMMFLKTKEGRVINHRWNFASLGNAVLLLFRTTTGDDWFNLLYDCSIQEPFCSTVQMEDGTVLSDCGRGAAGYIYFVVFYIGCNYVFLPLFVATLIDYFFQAEVESQSLFNEDECTKYAAVWQEFDEEKDRELKINQLRPFIDRLHAEKSAVGFPVAANLEKFKKIWAMTMTNPEYWEYDVEIPQAIIEKYGMRDTKLSKKNILKAFGNGPRAKALRKIITKEHGDEPMRFNYTAMVLVVHLDNIVGPLTTADLVNRGAALQKFVGLAGSGGGAKTSGGEAREWKEERRWMALGIHNRISAAAAARDNHPPEADHTDLKTIVKAIAVVKAELNPVIVDKEDPNGPKRPTGGKRDALQGTITRLEQAFADIVENLITQVTEMEPEVQGKLGKKQRKKRRRQNQGKGKAKSVLDLLLDDILEETTHRYAKEEVRRMDERGMISLQKGDALVEERRKTMYSRAAANSHEDKVLVEAVPRGWLNAQQRRAPKRMRAVSEEQLEEETRAADTGAAAMAARTEEAEGAREHRGPGSVGEAVETLRKEVVFSRPPVPKRSSSLQIGEAAGVLRDFVRRENQNALWHQLFVEQFAIRERREGERHPAVQEQLQQGGGGGEEQRLSVAAQRAQSWSARFRKAFQGVVTTAAEAMAPATPRRTQAPLQGGGAQGGATGLGGSDSEEEAVREPAAERT